MIPFNHSINSDGVVVETAAIGTADEKGIIKKDASGTDVQEVIGNQEADFRVGLVSNFRYKTLVFTCYGTANKVETFTMVMDSGIQLL